MGAEGDFYEMCKSSKELQDLGREPGNMEFFLLFFPWREEDSYRSNEQILFTIPEVQYFNDLHEKGIILDKLQMTWYAMKWRLLRDDIYREYPSTFDEAFLLITA